MECIPGYVGDSSDLIDGGAEGAGLIGGRAGLGESSVGVSEKPPDPDLSSSSMSCGMAGRDLSSASIGDATLVAACRVDRCFFFLRAINDSWQLIQKIP